MSTIAEIEAAIWGSMRYNLMGNAGHWFPGANAATFDAEEIRGALDGYLFAERIPAILREARTLLAEAPKKRLSAGGQGKVIGDW